MMEAVISGLVDEFPILAAGSYHVGKLKIPRKIAFTGALCFFMFLLGLPMTTNVSMIASYLCFYLYLYLGIALTSKLNLPQHSQLFRLGPCLFFQWSNWVQESWDLRDLGRPQLVAGWGVDLHLNITFPCVCLNPDIHLNKLIQLNSLIKKCF